MIISSRFVLWLVQASRRTMNELDMIGFQFSKLFSLALRTSSSFLSRFLLRSSNEELPENSIRSSVILLMVLRIRIPRFRQRFRQYSETDNRSFFQFNRLLCSRSVPTAYGNDFIMHKFSYRFVEKFDF